MIGTTICRRPGTDMRTPEERQEAELLAAFRKLDAKSRIRLLRTAQRGRVAA